MVKESPGKALRRVGECADGVAETIKKRSTHQVQSGEKVQSIISEAPGTHAPIGGVKVTTATGWFAARSSGTEDIYKIHAESFRGKDQLARIVKEAQGIVDGVLGAFPPRWKVDQPARQGGSGCNSA